MRRKRTILGVRKEEGPKGHKERIIRKQEQSLGKEGVVGRLYCC